MAKPVGDLQINLTANSSKFDSALTKSKGNVRAFKKETAFAHKEITAFKDGIGKLAVATGVVGGLVVGMNRAAEAADRIGKTAGRVGLTTDQLQELQYAAKLSSVETGTLDMAMQRFGRRLGEANVGMGELLPVLDQYNIATKDSEGNTRSVHDVLLNVADVMQKVRDPQERLRIATKAFDSEGAKLVETLKNGSAGLRNMAKEAHNLGHVVDSESIDSLTRYNDAIARLTGTLEKAGISFAGFIVQSVEKASIAIASQVYGVDAAVEAYDELYPRTADASEKQDELATNATSANTALNKQKPIAKSLAEELNGLAVASGAVAGGQFDVSQAAKDAAAAFKSYEERIDSIVQNAKFAELTPTEQFAELVAAITTTEQEMRDLLPHTDEWKTKAAQVADQYERALGIAQGLGVSTGEFLQLLDDVVADAKETGTALDLVARIMATIAAQSEEFKVNMAEVAESTRLTSFWARQHEMNQPFGDGYQSGLGETATQREGKVSTENPASNADYRSEYERMVANGAPENENTRSRAVANVNARNRRASGGGGGGIGALAGLDTATAERLGNALEFESIINNPGLTAAHRHQLQGQMTAANAELESRIGSMPRAASGIVGFGMPTTANLNMATPGPNVNFSGPGSPTAPAPYPQNEERGFAAMVRLADSVEQIANYTGGRRA